MEVIRGSADVSVFFVVLLLGFLGELFSFGLFWLIFFNFRLFFFPIPTSSFGLTLDYAVSENATEGTHFINIDYSQILLSNNVDPMPATKVNLALPIEVQKKTPSFD